MPDVQEVFRMATQKVRPELGFVDRQLDRQRRRARNRRKGAIALTAVIGALAAVLAIRIVGGDDAQQPVDQSSAPLERPTDGVAIVDVEGTIIRVIGTEGTEEAASLLRSPSLSSLSPDGSRLAVSNGSGIYTMNADGTDLAKLADGVDPDWSPDGSLIAFAHQGTIHVISPDGTGVRTVEGVGTNALWPVWSPDGERLAYHMLSTRSSKEGIYVVDAEGGRPTRLTRGFDLFPSWHPDGTTIEFTRVGRTEDLFTVAADGGARATPLAATDQGETDGFWSPSGDLFAYAMSSGMTELESDVRFIDIHVLDLRTGEDRVVLEGARPLGWASDRTLLVEL